jgi:hypothetical protein
VITLRILVFASLVACGPNAAPPARTVSPSEPSGAGTPRPSPTTQASPTSNEHEPIQADTSGTSSSGATIQERDAADPNLAATERAAYASAKPIFASYCAPCHSSQGSRSTPGARKHFDMDAYPFGGHHSDEIGREIREVLGASGARATMPKDKPGSVQGEELRLILAWADAHEQSHQRLGTTPDHELGTHEH